MTKKTKELNNKINLNNIDRINIKIVGEDNTNFSIKRECKFSTLLTSYCDLKKIDKELYKFSNKDGDNVPLTYSPNDILGKDKKDLILFVKQDNEINVNLFSNYGSKSMISFIIKRDTSFEKIFQLYCEKTLINKDKARFLYSGKYIEKSSTANDIKLNDNSDIYVLMGQVSA